MGLYFDAVIKQEGFTKQGNPKSGITTEATETKGMQQEVPLMEVVRLVLSRQKELGLVRHARALEGEAGPPMARFPVTEWYRWKGS